MKVLLGIVFCLVLPCALAEVGRCLKSWGVVFGLKEEALNKALLSKLITRVPQRHRTINMAETSTDGWFPLETKLENAVLKNVQIHAMQASMRVALLDLTFASGYASIKSGENYARQSLSNKHLRMRTSVNTYRNTLVEVRKNRYSLHLVIKDTNAIVPSENGTGIDFPQLNDIMKETFLKALTSILKRVLQEGNRYKLFEFDVPIPNPNDMSIVADLIPRDIDYTFYYDGRGSQSNSFGVLMSPPNTPAAENDEARAFRKDELVPSDADFALHIDSQAVMGFLDRTISEQDLFSGKSNPLYVANTCPAKVQKNNNIEVKVERMTLDEFEVRKHPSDSSIFEVYVKLHKKKVASGIDLEAWGTVGLRLEYDGYRQTFKPVVQYRHQGHKTHKKWWAHVINVLTLGNYIAIVDSVVDSKIKNKIVDALEVNLQGTDMPLNIGGVIGEAFDHMHFSNAVIDDNGNFMFKCKLAL